MLAKVSVATLTEEGLSGCGLVIESVPEDRAMKSAVLAAIERAAPAAIIATNTSGLSIAGLGEALQDPSRFLGLHFFSPAERMPLVEVVRGPKTTAASLAAALVFVRDIGKRPIVVRDGPGFFATGVFAAYLDEAVAMVAEGVAPPPSTRRRPPMDERSDRSPCSTRPAIALNLAQARQARADGLAPRFCRPLAAPTLALLVEAGRPAARWRRLLRLAGAGSPDAVAGSCRCISAAGAAAGSRGDPPAPVRSGGARSSTALRKASSQAPTTPMRLRCWASAIPNNGGVLRAAENFGLDAFVSLCDRLAAAHGDRFAPSPWLRELAARGDGLGAYREVTP